MGTSKPTGADAVDAHLATVPEPHQTTLRVVRAHLRVVLPHAEEGMKYNMPSFLVQGHGVAAYAAFKQHCSYFPFSGSVTAAAGPLPGGTPIPSGMQFPIDAPLPLDTVRALVRVRLAEMSKPANGKWFDYFDDGTVKAAGASKDGKPHGRWRWYRVDGSLERSGQYKAGEPTGIWETWDADGTLTHSERR
jgi:uncharacterized protein YdhG (YjbR/CyaY superfamily)